MTGLYNYFGFTGNNNNKKKYTNSVLCDEGPVSEEIRQIIILFYRPKRHKNVERFDVEKILPAFGIFRYKRRTRDYYRRCFVQKKNRRNITNVKKKIRTYRFLRLFFFLIFGKWEKVFIRFIGNDFLFQEVDLLPNYSKRNCIKILKIAFFQLFRNGIIKTISNTLELALQMFKTICRCNLVDNHRRGLFELFLNI